MPSFTKSKRFLSFGIVNECGLKNNITQQMARAATVDLREKLHGARLHGQGSSWFFCLVKDLLQKLLEGLAFVLSQKSACYSGTFQVTCWAIDVLQKSRKSSVETAYNQSDLHQ